jgi:hypothetical protein
MDISNMSSKVYTTSLSNILVGMKILTYNSKQIQILSITLEIRVQRSLVLPTQVSNCHLI